MILPVRFAQLALVALVTVAVHPARGAEGTAPPASPTRPAARIPIAQPDSMRSSEIYWVNGDTLVFMEQKTARPGGSTGTLPGLKSGPLGPKEWIELGGASSGFMIAEAQPHFRIAWNSESAQEIRLGVFEHEEDLRRARINSGKKDIFRDKIPLVIQEVRAGLYDLTPKRPLSSGEYGIGVPLRYGRPDRGGVVIVMVAAFTVQASGPGKQ